MRSIVDGSAACRSSITKSTGVRVVTSNIQSKIVSNVRCCLCSGSSFSNAAPKGRFNESNADKISSVSITDPGRNDIILEVLTSQDKIEDTYPGLLK